MKNTGYIWVLVTMALLMQGCFQNPEGQRRSNERLSPVMPVRSQSLPVEENNAAKQLEPTNEIEYYIPGYVREEDEWPVKKAPARKADNILGLHHENQVISGTRGFPSSPCIRRPAAVFQLHFDNDIFANTDYYYSSGLELTLFHPAVAHLPGSRLLVRGGKESIEHYGIRLVQNLYTPIDPDNSEVQYGDRPFSAFLLVGLKKIILYPEKKARLTSGIDVGIIGPGAMGGFVQKTVHQLEPVGWVNQISNDLVLNYQLAYAKGLVYRNGLELWAEAEGNAGTLYDNVSAGLLFKAGAFEPSAGALSLAEGSACRKIQYFISAGLRSRLVIYDATLQGGMFNQTSVYTLSSNDINRFVTEATVGIGFVYGQAGLYFTQHFNSAEFKGAKAHSWGRISLEYRL